MKKLLVFAFVLISSLVKAQSLLDSLPEINGKILYQSIVDVPNKNKDFIFNAVHKWAFDFYKNTTSFSEDKEQGQILGKAYFTVAPVMGFFVTDNKYRYDYSIEIDCKDNKYRIQIYDMTYKDTVNNLPSRPLEELNDEFKKTKNKPPHEIAYEIDVYPKWIISSLADAITKSAHDDF